MRADAGHRVVGGDSRGDLTDLVEGDGVECRDRCIRIDILPEDDRLLIIASQRPITLGANTTPSGAPAWKGRPVWAVIGTQDYVIPAEALRSMAERAGATITFAEGASHVSMVSQPDVAIAAILAAVDSVAAVGASA